MKCCMVESVVVPGYGRFKAIIGTRNCSRDRRDGRNRKVYLKIDIFWTRKEMEYEVGEKVFLRPPLFELGIG